ncbi:hypothetical protein DVH24_026847 [Malus domestica]|uniref:Pectate lyase domain-containing protein n=1 Tax=Malus domestica TaxID=3750 RepID=A0A498K4T9_MALDO|nr:hypothetical protein DVH24_026847 [Malus domestica]
MGNCHGHHRKRRNGPVSSETASSGFKYGLSGQAAQIPCSSSSSAKRTSNMVVALLYAHVDSILRALASQAEGFGRLTVGGLNGAVYHVTTLADGRGQRIKLTGKGLRLKECEHRIRCDGIQIKPNSKHIWIDRCSLRDYEDGLIDISRGSTNITISRCHFSQHDKTILIGADPSHIDDRCIRVTIHHCFFDGTRQRYPRVRFAKIFSECNIYEAGKKKVAFKYLTEKAADKETAVTGHIRFEGDLFVTGTQAGLSPDGGEHCMFHPTQHYQTWTKGPPVDDLMHVLQHCTGWQGVPRPGDQGVAT